MRGDTIAAISSAAADSGIGIVRVSGPDSFSVIDRIYRPKRGEKKLSEERSHTIHYGYIEDDGDIIDEVLVMIMRGPGTFTAEDTVEIDCHGGVCAMKKILETVIRNGARPAQPGEFTKRAFLNGRIDLSQAEAVMDVIQAKNEYALKNSVSQIRGSVRKEIAELRGRLLYHIAHIEAALDDPEHISLDGYKEEASKDIEEILQEVRRLISTADNGRILKEGIRTVIIGRPNAGKSSVLNALLGEERAIVTEIAGTTRDTLEETINLNGITLIITDTAGIRETEDVVEKIGIGKAREKLENADLVLYIVDSSEALDENDEEIVRLLQDKKCMILLNKSDMETVTTCEMVEAMIERETAEIKEISGCPRTADTPKRENFKRSDIRCKEEKSEREEKRNEERNGGTEFRSTPEKNDGRKEMHKYPIICISALEGTGIGLLEDKLKEMFYQGDIVSDGEICITNVRHKASLMDAEESLERVQESILLGMPEDFLTIDLMGACEALGDITGETASEDMINEIFGKFCLGK